MKLMHLSDLHLGKRVNGFSQIPDQKYILERILEIVKEQAPDAVLIAGDVYDKSVPSAEAVELCDWFLTRLAETGTRVMVTSGNHDSAERIAFGAKLLSGAGVHVSPVYDGTVTTVELEDEFGKVRFSLLPFLKPAHVRPFFPDTEITGYSDALETALAGCGREDDVRHVLIAHQLVTGAERSESEDISVGGTDNIDATVFEGFDYVALGHLHRPQNVGKNLRYCGTPLKYSFSEASHEKSVTLVTLKEKGNVTIDTIPLKPLRNLKKIRGTYMELTARSYYAGTDLPECYLQVTLTDEDDIPDALGRLRAVYPYIMNLDYDNLRTRQQQNPLLDAAAPESSPLELFHLLYEQQNNAPMAPEDSRYIQSLIETIWRDEA